jgi:hypothetical protein
VTLLLLLQVKILRKVRNLLDELESKDEIQGGNDVPGCCVLLEYLLAIL